MTENTELPPDVQRRSDAAEAEHALWFQAHAAHQCAFQAAHVTYLSHQVAWYAARVVDLNVEVREKDAELAQLRRQLAAYETSAAIEQEAAKPGDADLAP